MMATMNTLAKLLGETYPVTQIAFFRSTFALFLVVPVVMMKGGRDVFRTRQLGRHVFRSAWGFATLLLIFWSYQLLPLADATTIWFSGPLFLTALSVPFLGEKVGVHRWSAVVVGFGGVLIMLRPGAGVIDLGALVALGSAFGYAVAVINIRILSRRDPPDTLVLYFTLFTAVWSMTLLPFGWVTPAWQDLPLLCLTGLVGGLSQFCLTGAYSRAPAAIIAPFGYTQLLWAMLFGWLLWADAPDSPVLYGMLLVAGSGLYIIYRETGRRRSHDRDGSAPGLSD